MSEPITFSESQDTKPLHETPDTQDTSSTSTSQSPDFLSKRFVNSKTLNDSTDSMVMAARAIIHDHNSTTLGTSTRKSNRGNESESNTMFSTSLDDSDDEEESLVQIQPTPLSHDPSSNVSSEPSSKSNTLHHTTHLSSTSANSGPGASSGTSGVVQYIPTKQKRRTRRRRSPNRDDSDSDEDDHDSTQKGSDAENLTEEGDPQSQEEGVVFDDIHSKLAGFKAGWAEDRNKRYRRTMEDSHTIIYNFLGVPGSAFFAVFDGHAGRAAAEYCGEHLHKVFGQLLTQKPDSNVCDLLNETFATIDKQLSEKKGMHSGCTAVVAFIRVEERCSSADSSASTEKRRVRVLYTANVGDARAVLSRGGTALRLSYDHKGSDGQEARRILEAGGFVMNNRVNGVLAVTRSLGDASMKEWVIGTPYTTETVLTEHDTFLIVACDGIWDVCNDQSAVDLLHDISDPQEASDSLLDYALDNRSTDNLTVIVARLNVKYLEETTLSS